MDIATQDDENVGPSVHDNEYENYANDDAADESRLDKSRERNREHARRTRLRKKALMENMKTRLLDLQKEVFVLNYTISFFIVLIN